MVNNGIKTVLIVDDERTLLESLKEGFREHANDFTILTAEHGAKASVILKSMPVDLVITDLKMPVMDGFELLAYMSKHHPRVPTIIMSAHGTRPDISEKLKLFSTSQYLQKPFELDELAAAIMAKLNIASVDNRQALTLPAFLQMIADEQRTCTLTAEFAGEKGVLYFRNGELLDAGTGALSGDAAVRYMATWDHAKYDISRQCERTVKKVSGQVGDLLMEGRARKDEQRTVAAGKANAAHEAGGIVAEAEKHARAASVQTAAAAAPSVDKPHKKETTSKEGNMATTREILSELAKMPNIEAVCLVARDGFLLDSIARSGIDREMVGAIASSGFGAADSMGRQLEKGKLQISMLEFEKGPVMLEPIGEDAFLVVVADREANLGMIRLKLKKHGQELALAAAI